MQYRNNFLYAAGMGFLSLAKARDALFGYSSPKPFDVSETARCIAYDTEVAEHWLTQLRKYTNDESNILGKNVLELGPGSDLGIGLYLLAKGCLQYNACDVNDLMNSTPESFYNEFIRHLESMDIRQNVEFLSEQVREMKNGNPSRLNYVVRKDFDLAAAFGESSVDIVFSHAAFEHFNDIETTISQLSVVCKPGAILVAEIDLKTHSRWIRKMDPNNIYRYSDYVYKKFWFRGIPNRIRPFQYKEELERNDWVDVSITPIEKIHEDNDCYSGLDKKFSNKKNCMSYLSIMLCARKK